MKAAFQVEVASSESANSWSAKGLDEVRYMISANQGEPLRDMEQAASGGELSRVMFSPKVLYRNDFIECQENRPWAAHDGFR